MILATVTALTVSTLRADNKVYGAEYAYQISSDISLINDGSNLKLQKQE